MNYITQMNQYADKNIPFLFIIPYDQKGAVVVPLAHLEHEGIRYALHPAKQRAAAAQKMITHLSPPEYTDYENRFNTLREEFIKGNTFLANLTFKTKIEIQATLKEIYEAAHAEYKLLYKNQFVCFSPETFIKTGAGYLYTYPMKGTISTALPDAERLLIEDEKEFAEHITIVDLLRNDIGIVSDSVEVTNFRYIQKISAVTPPLLQTVSEIRGKLTPYFQEHPGDLMAALLPAGSISGAPKKKTVELLGEIENYERGFYTGVFGVWENAHIDSAVMIRFIERENDGYYYKSGGGITVYSDPRKEYRELIEKIYVPVY